MGQSEIAVDSCADFVVFVVPPGSGDGLQGAKKGIMEIADLIVVNKYDDDYKKVCQRLKRQIQGALTLTMSKHMYGVDGMTGAEPWFCPVELVSARDNLNVDSIWKHSQDFKVKMGEKYLKHRRQSHIKKEMWSYLSESLLERLRANYSDNTYRDHISKVEEQLLSSRIGGHEAAHLIMKEIFK